MGRLLDILNRQVVSISDESAVPSEAAKEVSAVACSTTLSSSFAAAQEERLASVSVASPSEAAKEVSVVAKRGCEKSEEYNQEYFFRRFARQTPEIDASIGGFVAAIARAFDIPPDKLVVRPAPRFPTTPERFPPVHWLAATYCREPAPICTCCGGSDWRALTHTPGTEVRAWGCTTCRPTTSVGEGKDR
jgi:hypothetical protein